MPSGTQASRMHERQMKNTAGYRPVTQDYDSGRRSWAVVGGREMRQGSHDTCILRVLFVCPGDCPQQYSFLMFSISAYFPQNVPLINREPMLDLHTTIMYTLASRSNMFCVENSCFAMSLIITQLEARASALSQTAQHDWAVQDPPR